MVYVYSFSCLTLNRRQWKGFSHQANSLWHPLDRKMDGPKFLNGHCADENTCAQAAIKLRFCGRPDRNLATVLSYTGLSVHLRAVQILVAVKYDKLIQLIQNR